MRVHRAGAGVRLAGAAGILMVTPGIASSANFMARREHLMAEASGIDKVRVQCHSCGAKFKAPASKAGKKGPCPKCGTMLIVPRLEPAAATGAAAGNVDWSMLSDAAPPPADAEDPVLAMAAAGPAAAPAKSKKSGGFFSRSRTSAGETSALGPTALAGLTPEQREMLAARVQDKLKKNFQRFDDEEPTGGFPSFPAGIVLAIFGALLGAAMWFAMLAGTGRELRFLAIMVGVLAGGGMYMGYQKRNTYAGVLAACIVLGAVIAAKFAFVWWSTPFVQAAKPAPVVSKVEQQIDDTYKNPDPDEVYGAAHGWISQDYLYENNLTREQLGGMMEWDLERHQWKINDRRDALTAEEGFDVYHRWTMYSDQVEQRIRQASREYDEAQGFAVSGDAEEEGNEEGMLTEDESAEDGAEEPEAPAKSADDGEDELGDPDEPKRAPVEWSPEKIVAMDQARRDFFIQIKEQEPEIAKKYVEDKQEAERRAAKIAAKQAGEDIQEKFTELGEDPAVAAAAKAQAEKYAPVNVWDLLMIPLGMVAAWFLGRGWD